jgi:phosphatidylglycerophosphate synthase
MGLPRAWGPNAVCFSRVGCAFVFVWSFRLNAETLLIVSIWAAVLAQLSDHLDGLLARKLGVVSDTGWLFDSVADRAFYIAALLAFHREYGLSEALLWLFTMREITLYAARVALGNFQAYRTGALWHAGVIRIGIALGCAAPFGILPSLVQQHAVALVSLIFWTSTILGYALLVRLLRFRG